jgi:CubicO group peptidase (beta-lactamase class C family)
MKRLACSGILLLAAAGAHAQSMSFPGADWATSSPEAQGVNSTLLNDAVNYLKANAPFDGVNELAIIRNGVLIWKGSNIDKRHGVWSCTKSFTSTVLGLLVDDGRTTLDARASTVLSSLSTTYPGVTFRHFTTMTSGYFAVGDNYTSHGQSSTPFTPSTTPLFTPPGSKYAYWDSAMNQFANALTRVAGEPVEELFRRRIATPIGMRATDWDWGDWGVINGIVVNGGAGNGNRHVQITARQMARLGHLYLNRGNWNGRQLLSAAWVDAATRPQVPSTMPLGHPQASPINGPGVYGFNWWANGIQSNGARKWPGAPTSTFSASGANNNDMFVIPDWGMVIVRLGLDGFSGFNISDATYSTFLQKVGQSVGAVSPPPAAQAVTSFTLVNADSNQDIGPLASGATLNLATLPTRNLNVRANTSPSVVGSVRFALDGNTNFRTESAAPYALAGDASGDYNAWTPAVGSHTLTATPYSGSGATGTPGTSLTVTFSVTDGGTPPPPSGPAVVSFTLINADTDQDIGPLTSGMTISSGNYSVRANTSPATVGSVRFGLDGNANFHTENAAPYSLAGDASGDYAPWTPAGGSHTLTATPYTGSDGTGTAGTALTVTFTVQGSTGGGLDTSTYRIGLSHDGNQHDPDDILAVAMALAIIGEAGLHAKFVHCDYSNHLGDNNASMNADMDASAIGAAQRWNLPASRLFNCQTNLTGAINSIRDAINASSATDRFYFLCAGPMEMPWRGIMAADPAKRQYCTAISHSTWNDTHADTPQMTHTWSDIQQTGVRTVHISDQNAGMSSDVSNWTWLRDSGVEAWNWLYGRRRTSLFDCSDAGMVYFVITGRGDQNGNASKIRDLFLNGPGGYSAGGGGATPQAVTGFTLINADTDLPVPGFDPLNGGATLNLRTLPTRNLNVRANTSPSVVGSVRFSLDGNSTYRVENAAPYALAGDSGGNYNPWTPSVGSHSVGATPYTLSSGGGTAGTSKVITFTVVDDATTASVNGWFEDAGGDGGGGESCGALGLEALAAAGLLAGLRRRRA